ncbi:MAG: hydroxyisourate hydrolase [Paracoccaceae bacterium]
MMSNGFTRDTDDPFYDPRMETKSPMQDSKNAIELGGISIHAVDVSRGVPAAGLAVKLMLVEPSRKLVAEGVCTDTGHFEHPVAKGVGVTRGLYEVEFDVGAYFRNAEIQIPDPSFLDVAVFRFGIDAVKEHFHLPFKFTPWGFSLFRGGA